MKFDVFKSVLLFLVFTVVVFFVLCSLYFGLIVYINPNLDKDWINTVVTSLAGGGPDLSAFSDVLGVVLGVPVTLVGTLFAIFIAFKSYRLSEDTSDLNKRVESLQSQHVRMEQRSLYDSRYSAVFDRLSKLDDRITSANLLGAHLQNLFFLDRTDVKSNGRFKEVKDHLNRVEALNRELICAADDISSDPLTNRVFMDFWAKNVLLRIEREFRGLDQPTRSLSNVQPLNFLKFHEDSPSIESLTFVRKVALGKYTYHRQRFGLPFWGWLFPNMINESTNDWRDVSKSYSNYYGWVLNEIWKVIPTKAELQEYLAEDARENGILDRGIFYTFSELESYYPSLTRNEKYYKQIRESANFYERAILEKTFLKETLVNSDDTEKQDFLIASARASTEQLA